MRSKPNKEDFLAGQLEAHGVRVCYPRIRVRAANPRARQVRSYFPGYLFVQVDLETVDSSILQWMPGAAGLISYGGEFASIPEALIVAIRRRVDEINAGGGELFTGLKPGDTVVIQDGPFAGYAAIFDSRLSGGERVRVLLRLLQKRMFPLDLPAGQVRRIKRT